MNSKNIPPFFEVELYEHAMQLIYDLWRSSPYILIKKIEKTEKLPGKVVEAAIEVALSQQDSYKREFADTELQPLDIEKDIRITKEVKQLLNDKFSA